MPLTPKQKCKQKSADYKCKQKTADQIVNKQFFTFTARTTFGSFTS